MVYYESDYRIRTLPTPGNFAGKFSRKEERRQKGVFQSQ
jgi:hypothetical protein